MMFIQKRRIYANEEMEPEMEAPMDDAAGGSVQIDPEASDLLFEAEDVAELVAEITQQPVDVEADGNTVKFSVGEDEFTVEADGDEEILESVRRPLRRKKPVAASTRRPGRRPAPAPTRRSASARRPVSASSKVSRRYPSK